MAEVCKKHNIKLLTYGTLCGGLLAEKWLGQEPPDLYSDEATPSLRKVRRYNEPYPYLESQERSNSGSTTP